MELGERVGVGRFDGPKVDGASADEDDVALRVRRAVDREKRHIGDASAVA
jgi:hypothetical protein